MRLCALMAGFEQEVSLCYLTFWLESGRAIEYGLMPLFSFLSQRWRGLALSVKDWYDWLRTSWWISLPAPYELFSSSPPKSIGFLAVFRYPAQGLV
ncbi:hypothetical protein A2U01_0014614, partial [Trifolium medium]|nr:hypothetical protein [Trifolium medium]